MSLHRQLRCARTQRGAATAELALVLPLLLIVTIAVVDFALGVRAYNSLAYAAREGTRYASVHSGSSRDPATVTMIRDRIRSRVVLMDESNLEVAAQWTPSNTRGSAVRVTLTYPYQPITPLFPLRTITLSSSAQMIISE